MKSERKVSTAYRMIICVAIMIVAALMLFVLNKPAGEMLETKKVVPKIGFAPVYAELKDGVPYGVSYTPAEDMMVGALELLFVNFDKDSDGEMLIKITEKGADPDDITYLGYAYPEQITIGEWSSVPAVFDMTGGTEYDIEFTADGFEPFFMVVEDYEPGVSLGFDVRTGRILTYGDIFYYSIPLTVLVATVLILLILFGYDRLSAALGKIFGIKNIDDTSVSESGKVCTIGSVIFCAVFMIILFAALSLDIYKTAYMDGIYITADSDGYLREAVNLIHGNGFSYEGLAGYRSHFANWPIIYPAMIAGMMMVTGTNAYLASKLVAIVIIGLIFITLGLVFKEKAWIYALALTDSGFLAMAYNTWSEIPFVLFLLLFGFALGRIVSEDSPKILTYIALGSTALAAFLTRYFGIYLWFVAGLYWILILCRYISSCRDNDALKAESASKTQLGKKLIAIAVSMGTSAALALTYLAINKIRNGNPTGVSRGTWWDDYHTLTDDLIRSLVTEIFNIFSFDVPDVIAKMSPRLQVWIILLAVVLTGALIHTCLDRIAAGSEGTDGSESRFIGKGIERYMNIPCVFIVMAIVYYLMFIAVRYRSSMDTFYFRFFAPATVIFLIGLIGLLLKAYSGKNLTAGRIVSVALLFIIAVSALDTTEDIYDMRDEKTYYEIATSAWDEAYREIPDHSVILWNPMDYRSSWYRPDVYSGELFMDDDWDSLCDRYYGSDHICMLRLDAETVISDGSYDKTITDRLTKAVNDRPDNVYIVLDK